MVGILSNSGTLLARYTYDPWGKLTSVKNASGVTITDASNIALRNPFRYRSYMYDDETGFYYLRARYYDPVVKRFLNADDADIIDGANANILENNLFAYCFDNPVNMQDDDGNWPGWLTKVIVGTVCAVAAVAITVATAGTGAAAIVPAIATVAKTVAVSAAVGAGGGVVSHKLVNNPTDPYVTVELKQGAVVSRIRQYQSTGKYESPSVKPIGSGYYQIENGHHTVEAMRSIGKKTMKVWLLRE